MDIKPGNRVKYDGVLVTENNQKNRFSLLRIECDRRQLINLGINRVFESIEAEIQATTGRKFPIIGELSLGFLRDIRERVNNRLETLADDSVEAIQAELFEILATDLALPELNVAVEETEISFGFDYSFDLGFGIDRVGGELPQFYLDTSKSNEINLNWDSNLADLNVAGSLFDSINLNFGDRGSRFQGSLAIDLGILQDLTGDGEITTDDIVITNTDDSFGFSLLLGGETSFNPSFVDFYAIATTMMMN